MDLKQLTKTIKELELRVSKLEETSGKRPLPIERVPNAYVLMVDTLETEDDLVIVGVIHMLPNRGKSHSRPVSDARLSKDSAGVATIRTIGASLSTIMTYCPEKLTIYTGLDTSLRSEGIAKVLCDDLKILSQQFPVEVEVGIPPGFKEEIKSLMLQAELEYIRQKEKVDVTACPRSSKDS